MSIGVTTEIHSLEDARRALEELNNILRGVDRELIQRLRGEFVQTVTTTYSILVSNFVILADASGGAFTVTLPDPNEARDHRYTVVKVDATANVTVDGGSGNINGSASVTLTTQYERIDVVSDGSNWFRVD